MPQILGYAVIGAGGDQRQSSGLAKMQHVEAGMWNLHFDFSVEEACEVASIANPETAGWITAYGVPTLGDNVVQVCMGLIVEGEPEKADLTFQVLVVS